MDTNEIIDNQVEELSEIDFNDRSKIDLNEIKRANAIAELLKAKAYLAIADIAEEIWRINKEEMTRKKRR